MRLSGQMNLANGTMMIILILMSAADGVSVMDNPSEYYHLVNHPSAR
jgi:hypothetical protein